MNRPSTTNTTQPNSCVGGEVMRECTRCGRVVGEDDSIVVANVVLCFKCMEEMGLELAEKGDKYGV